jgi:hypothetical protein
VNDLFYEIGKKEEKLYPVRHKRKDSSDYTGLIGTTENWGTWITGAIITV